MTDMKTLSVVGKTPLNANGSRWATVSVAYSPDDGGHRVYLDLDGNAMGSDAAVALAALLGVADKLCREAAEYALTHNPALVRRA